MPELTPGRYLVLVAIGLAMMFYMIFRFVPHPNRRGWIVLAIATWSVVSAVFFSYDLLSIAFARASWSAFIIWLIAGTHWVLSRLDETKKEDRVAKWGIWFLVVSIVIHIFMFYLTTPVDRIVDRPGPPWPFPTPPYQSAAD